MTDETTPPLFRLQLKDMSGKVRLTQMVTVDGNDLIPLGDGIFDPEAEVFSQEKAKEYREILREQRQDKSGLTRFLHWWLDGHLYRYLYAGVPFGEATERAEAVIFRKMNIFTGIIIGLFLGWMIWGWT